MNSAYRAQGVAILLLALVLLSGCQAFGKWGGKKPAAKNPSSLGEMLSGKGIASKSLDRTQKSDVEMAMARSLEKQGKSDEALKVYLHVIEKDESQADAYHRVALIYDRQGACDKSREYYLAALKSLPENAELNSDFGYSCYLQERWDEAEKHLRRAVELKPTLARAHNNLGMLLARKGREEEALAEFGRAGCTRPRPIPTGYGNDAGPAVGFSRQPSEPGDQGAPAVASSALKPTRRCRPFAGPRRRLHNRPPARPTPPLCRSIQRLGRPPPGLAVPSSTRPGVVRPWCPCHRSPARSDKTEWPGANGTYGSRPVDSVSSSQAWCCGRVRPASRASGGYCLVPAFCNLLSGTGCECPPDGYPGRMASRGRAGGRHAGTTLLPRGG